jgi:uncharacterized membrane protein
MDKQLLSKVIQRKRKALKTYTLEQTAIAGFISGFIGLILGGFYTAILGGIIWNISNVLLYAIIGSIIGYFNSKNKKEDLQIELMILESFEDSYTN